MKTVLYNLISYVELRLCDTPRFKDLLRDGNQFDVYVVHLLLDVLAQAFIIGASDDTVGTWDGAFSMN